MNEEYAARIIQNAYRNWQATVIRDTMFKNASGFSEFGNINNINTLIFNKQSKFNLLKKIPE